MKKITKPHKENQKAFIFTEEMNYFKIGKNSIWGSEDNDLLKILKTVPINGKWLNLAAGDGRYNSHFLKQADKVVAVDIDRSALSKLWHRTNKRYRQKLVLNSFNIAKKIPLENRSFDGIFCTAALHLFPKSIFLKISKEIDRILKINGKIAIEFATDVERIRFDGKPYIFQKEPKYTTKEAITLIKEVFKNYKLKIHKFKKTEIDFPEANPPYKFSGRGIFVTAQKIKD